MHWLWIKIHSEHLMLSKQIFCQGLFTIKESMMHSWRIARWMPWFSYLNEASRVEFEMNKLTQENSSLSYSTIHHLPFLFCVSLVWKQKWKTTTQNSWLDFVSTGRRHVITLDIHWKNGVFSQNDITVRYCITRRILIFTGGCLYLLLI